MATSRARPIEQPVVDNLPPYLGFGTLDPGSVRVDGEHLIARYAYADGSTAYRVDWQPGRCLLVAHVARCACQRCTSLTPVRVALPRASVIAYPEIRAQLHTRALARGAR